jgi:hypothetical protein
LDCSFFYYLYFALLLSTLVRKLVFLKLNSYCACLLLCLSFRSFFFYLLHNCFYGLIGILRWYVHRGTKRVNWIGSRDALWYDSCTIHTDKQRNGCHGKISVSYHCFHALPSRRSTLLTPFQLFCSLTSTRTMILADVQEFTALDNPAFQLASRTFLGQVLWKYIVLGVRIFIIRGPSIKAVSLWPFIYY